MQYTFNLTANQSQVFDVGGTWFKYVQGTGRIRITTARGRIDLLPGQGFANLPFARLEVEDRTGAANIGTFLAGAFDMIDDRVAGQVEVIDGGRARTLSNASWIASFTRPAAGAGLLNQVGVFVPAGSERRAIVKLVRFSSTTAQTLQLATHNAGVGAVGASPLNKYVNQAATFVTERRDTTAAAGVGLSFYGIDVPANETTVFIFDDPIVIEPGNGLYLWNGTLNTDLRAAFEGYEESLT